MPLGLLFGLNAQDSTVDSLNYVLSGYLNNDTARVNVLVESSENLQIENKEKAIAYANEALSLAEELNYDKGIAQSAKQLGLVYHANYEHEKALAYYEKSLQYFEELNAKMDKALVLGKISTIYLFKGQFETAIEYQLNAQTINEELNDTVQIASGLTTLGIISVRQRSFTNALKYFTKGYDSFKKLDNKLGMARNLNGIGVCYYLQEDFDGAIAYYKNAMVIFEELDDKPGIINISTNIGNIYILQKKYDEALRYFNESLTLTRTTQNKKNIASALINIANLYRDWEKYGEAEDCYKEALKLSAESKAENTLGTVAFNLARLYLKQDKISLAYQYAKQAYDIAHKNKDIRVQKKSSEILASTCEKLGRYKDAYNYHVVFKQTSDSLFNEANIKEVTNLKNQYEFDKEKEAIAAEQAQKDAINKSEVKRERKLRNVFIGGSIIFLILALIILRNLKQKQKANRLLADKNKKIKSQSKELKTANESLVDLSVFKEDMTNMIAHDLKNPISTILNIDIFPNETDRIKMTKYSGKIMMNLVQNMLDVYKYQSVKMVLETSLIDVQQIINNAIEEVHFVATKRNVAFKLEQENVIKVNADMNILHRILVNILSNAVKFAPDSSLITITAFIAEGNSCKISIHNAGPHISQENQLRIFERFTQSEKRDQGQLRSTGLGLTFCKMAVEAHDGQIGVVSAENHGATFWFILPHANEYGSLHNDKDKKARSSESIHLSKAEKEGLQPLYIELKQLSVNQISDFRKIYSRIVNEKLGNTVWSNALQNAVYNCNQQQFIDLVKMIID